MNNIFSTLQSICLLLLIFCISQAQANNIKEQLKNILPANAIIVEAGAHNGSDTEEFATLWPQGTIHAFEPVPLLFEQLQKQTEKYKNVICYPFALSNEINEARFFVSRSSQSLYECDASSSLLQPTKHLTTFPCVKFTEEIIVTTLTLDDWADIYDIKKIDFMWLDLQGSEPLVLMHCPNILKTVKAIYTEVNTEELYAGSILYPELKNFMKQQGFTLTYEKLLETGQGDALFVRLN